MQCVDNKLDHFVLLTDSFIIWETFTLIAFEATVIAGTFKTTGTGPFKMLRIELPSISSICILK